MRYDPKIALPFLLAASGGALNALLPVITTYHPSTQIGLLMVGVGGVMGDWLRAQIAIGQAKQAALPPAPPAPPTPALLSSGQPTHDDAVAQVLAIVLKDWAEKMNTSKVLPADSLPSTTNQL